MYGIEGQDGVASDILPFLLLMLDWTTTGSFIVSRGSRLLCWNQTLRLNNA